MKPSELEQTLREIRFTEDMPPATLEKLAAVIETDVIKKGTMLFREGSPHDKLYLIRDGKIALQINVPTRGQVTVLTVGPGEAVGWSGLVGEGKMTSSAVALEDTEVLQASCMQLNELCHSDHRFCHYLLRNLAKALGQRLVATRLQFLDLLAGK